MKLKQSVFIALFLIISNMTMFAQLTNEQVDSLVNNAMETFKVAGSAVAIVKDGKIIYQKGFGVTSKATNQPVNEHTNFAIASNSKAFTTAALAFLVEEGKINWTDKVITHIPEFTMYNPYVQQNFNIQDLLTHRSGLGLGMGDLMFFPDGSDFTIDDLLSSFQHFKPVSAFRTKWPISPVWPTCVPPHNSIESPNFITLTRSPYFSPNNANAPISTASVIGIARFSFKELFSRISLFTNFSTEIISSSDNFW